MMMMMRMIMIMIMIMKMIMMIEQHTHLGDWWWHNDLYFVQNLPTGDSAQSVTSNIVTVTDRIHGPKAPMWVDTPGKSEHDDDEDQYHDQTRISSSKSSSWSSWSSQSWTPGWSDSEGLSDQNTFKEMLRHLQKNKLNTVKVKGFTLVAFKRRNWTM